MTFVLHIVMFPIITSSRQPVHVHKLHSLLTGCRCANCNLKGSASSEPDNRFLSVSVTAANLCLGFIICFCDDSATGKQIGHHSHCSQKDWHWPLKNQ